MKQEMEYRLLSCNSLSESLTMFFGLTMNQKLSVFSEEVSIAKGTEFYRIRQIDDKKDPNDPREWEPVPVKFAKQGRFNETGESVLYVASTPDYLEREVRLKENDEYFLAKYVCKESFKVGSFLGVNSQVNTLIHKIAMSVAGVEDLTGNEKDLLDKYYDWAKNRSLVDLSVDMLASLYIYRMLPNLYDVTNILGKLVLKKNDNGIRYSSVFVPFELSGVHQIVTFDGLEYGNYVLTQKGYKNIDLISVEKRIAKKPYELNLLISEFSKAVKGE